MRYIVLVEETVSEEFPVDAENAKEAEEKARKLYRAGEMVLEPGNPEEVKFMALPAEE